MERALQLDQSDPLRSFRQEFSFPKRKNGQEAIYMCGNSLGLQPKQTRTLLMEELTVWENGGVQGHFDHAYGRPWVNIDAFVKEESAKLVGGLSSEVSIMNSLTANLHFLMVSFYRPTPGRYKILMESKAFPSDIYAIESQVNFHHLDPKDAIIALSPRDGEYTLRTSDILDTIEKEGDSIALVLFSGVQFYTGQWFDMPAITNAARAKGCVVGFDLAHAVGNVPLKLHEWNIDFAVWVIDKATHCSYKYLNSGPGSIEIGGAFVHEKHHSNLSLPRFSGWWGTQPETKFDMEATFKPILGTDSYRLSNPCVLAVVSVLGSLNVFAKTSMDQLRQKSLLLTGFLESQLQELQAKHPVFKIITPSDPQQRGCQLSILFHSSELMERVYHGLMENGCICDDRKPNVIRIAPTPLYNSFLDVYECVQMIQSLL